MINKGIAQKKSLKTWKKRYRLWRMREVRRPCRYQENSLEEVKLSKSFLLASVAWFGREHFLVRGRQITIFPILPPSSLAKTTRIKLKFWRISLFLIPFTFCSWVIDILSPERFVNYLRYKNSRYIVNICSNSKKNDKLWNESSRKLYRGLLSE